MDMSGEFTLLDRVDSSIMSNTPYEEQYYLFDFILVTLEESCREYAQKVNLQEKHRSRTWRSINIKGNRACDDLHWFRLDKLELNEWAELLRSLRWCWLPGGEEPENWDEPWAFHRTISALEQFRHDTIHRRKQRARDVLDVMRLPGYLKDDSRAQEIQKVYDLWRVEVTREEAMNILRRPRAMNQGHRLLSKVQNLLEVSLFGYAQRVYGGSRARRCWECAEKVELQNWESTHILTENTHFADFYPEPSTNLYRSIFASLRTLRNAASHRSEVSRWKMMKLLKSSIMITMLMDDQVQALEIEVLGEQWLTKRSRVEVLSRFQRVFLDIDQDETDLEFQNSPTRTPGPITEQEEIKKRFAKRERKRRYSIAKVLLSSSKLFKGARPRTRCFPECSFRQSLPANLYIVDDEDIGDQHDSVIYEPPNGEQGESLREASLKADARSYRDLPQKEKSSSDDDGWNIVSDPHYQGWITQPDTSAAGEASERREQEKSAVEEAKYDEDYEEEDEENYGEGYEKACGEKYEEEYEEYGEEYGEEYEEEYEEEYGKKYEEGYGKDYEEEYEEIYDDDYDDNESCEDDSYARIGHDEKSNQGVEEEESTSFLFLCSKEAEVHEIGFQEHGTEDPQDEQHEAQEPQAQETDAQDPATEIAPDKPCPTTPLDPNNPFACFEFSVTYDDIQASLPEWERDKGMFGRFRCCYDQILSPSMHGVYKLTEAEMRRRGWELGYRR